MERSVKVRGAIALVALGCCLATASAMASGAAHRHRRTHRPAPAAPAAAAESPSIALTPSTVKLAHDGTLTTSITGSGFAVAMPVTIDTSTLDAECSTTAVHSDEGGPADAGTTRAGLDGRWTGNLAGRNCQPGVYAVAVQEQALPYQTFVATLTVTL